MLEHKILIDEDTLNKRIEELANQISKTIMERTLF